MKKSNGIFITGTDTGIGKTVVSAAMLCALKSAGVDAVYMKPVQTGYRKKSGRLIAPDLEFVLSAAGISPPEKERRFMAPYCFRKPCSPHLAAALAKRSIRLSRIVNSFRALGRLHDFIIVEGAGGVLTPLGRRLFMLDIMKTLALPVILVARPGLGTLNHTLLAIQEIRRAKLPIAGVVLNYAHNIRKTIIEDDNRKTIERLGRVRVIAELPFMRELQINARSIP